MKHKTTKLRKIFHIVIPKACPQCGKRALKKVNDKIICTNCHAVIETKLEDSSWFFSSQDKSILLDLKKELIAKKNSIKERLLELKDMRKIL